MKVDNDEIFIIGGGSSLIGFPFNQLKDKNTIAVNMAALDVPNPTYCITADSSIFRRIQEGYFKSVNTTWVMVTNPEHCSMKFRDGVFRNMKTGYIHNPFCVNMLIRNAGTDGIGFSFNDFKTGYNSGFCGFQLAILLRYKKIYLLGFDLNTKAARCHYHNRYQDGKKRIHDKHMERYYNNFKLAFETIKKETDIEVISCSRSSRLNQLIPYKSFGEL